MDRQPSTSRTNAIGLQRVKLTPSCARCRSKKLKCRYADKGATSCNICLERGIGNECHRDVRMTRGRRIRLSETESSNATADVVTFTPEQQGDVQMTNRRAEIALLRRKLWELESLERESSKPITPSPSDRNTHSTSSLDGQSGSSSSHPAVNRYTQRQDEDVAHILEDFAAHGARVTHSVPLASTSTLPRDIAQNKWQKVASLDERLELLRAAKQCRFASDEVIVRELVSVYLYRVNHLVGHVIYSPGYRRAIEAFLSMSIEEIVMSKIFIDPCCLATMMLVLCLGFEFHPHQPPPGRAASPGFLAVQAIRQQSIDPTQYWYDIARKSLAVEDSYHLSSIPAFQAACLFLARGRESVGWMRMMHQVVISSAREFGLHSLGKAEAEPWMQIDDFIRLECGVRIWNYLKMRDWSLATDQTHLPLVHPEDMTITTRKPLNLDDEDLELEMQESRHTSDWTSMSFVIAQVELAQLIKDSATIQDRGLLQQRAEGFLQGLPPYFQLDSRVNHPGLVPVQRWLLHQQIFDLQLRLCRSDLVNTASRARCLELAEKVIDHQANIRAICPIIDSLQINFFHLFGACMVVLLDLLHQGTGRFKTEHNKRLLARSKIIGALESFPEKAKYMRALRVLRIMLECEKEQHLEKQSRITPRESECDNLSSVARRIITEVQAGLEPAKYQTERHREVWPSLLSYRPIPDQTLLPMVGAWRPNPASMASSTDGKGVDSGSFSFDQDTPSSASNLHQRSPVDESQGMATDNDGRPLIGSVFDLAIGLALDPFEERRHSNPVSVTRHYGNQIASMQHHLSTPRSSGKASIFNPVHAQFIISAP